MVLLANAAGGEGGSGACGALGGVSGRQASTPEVGVDEQSTVTIPVGDVHPPADLMLPAQPVGVVLFAHGSGSSRHSPRNVAVARTLNGRGLGTVLVDLLSPAEDEVDARTAE